MTRGPPPKPLMRRGLEGGRRRGSRPCGRAVGTKCRRRTWRRRLCYPARRRSSKWQRRENVAQREMRDKGGSAAPAGTPPGGLRPGRDSSPGSLRLLLLVFLSLYNFATLVGSRFEGSPSSIGLPNCPRDHPPCSALTACVVPLPIKTRALWFRTATNNIGVKLLLYWLF